MRAKKPLVFVAVLLLLSIVNFTRISGTENIRPIHFLSIFAIGMLSGILIRELVVRFRQSK
ncbi:MAG: hypothetical protein ACKVOW_13955 [Chitinophagaceae bacterium]